MRQAFDKMNDQIQKYLSIENTDYAILLDGEWGCGKTYYIEELIEKSKDILFIYYSLNGAADICEIVNSVIIQAFFEKKYGKKIDKLIKKTFSFINRTKEISDIVKVTNILGGAALSCLSDVKINKTKPEGKQTVLVFDDLERISEEINITDLLGAIHNKFTLNNIKVIYIADKGKIKNQSEFNDEKEKYIQREISFSNNTNEVLKSLLDKAEIYSEKFIKILQEVFCGEQENLRTIKFCIDCYLDIAKSCSELSCKEYNSPEELFYSICQIGKFYRKGFTDKNELKEQLDNYFYLQNFQNNNQNKTDYAKFAINFGSKLIKQGFIYELIYDGIFSDEAVKFFLRKPEHKEDPIYKLSDISEMETTELVSILNNIQQNILKKNYNFRQYEILRNSFVPYYLKLNTDVNKDEILSAIRDSILDEKNREELLATFRFWLKDSFSSIKNPNNVIEEKVLEEFKKYCDENITIKVEQFFQNIKNCSRELFVDIQEHDRIFTLLIEKNYGCKILALSNKSIRFFSYYVDSAICHLINANEVYGSEIPALQEISRMCIDETQRTDKTDILRIEALIYLENVLETAIKHIQ